MRYRLRRIEELTGRSLADPEAIGQIHLAMEAVRIFGWIRIRPDDGESQTRPTAVHADAVI